MKYSIYLSHLELYVTRHVRYDVGNNELQRKTDVLKSKCDHPPEN